MKRKIACLLVLFSPLPGLAQGLDEVKLGVIKGELGKYHGTLSWVNNLSDTVSGKYWVDQEWLHVAQEGFTAAPQDTLRFNYWISLEEVRGVHQAEVRILDRESIVLHGFLLEGRVQEPDSMALETYRNEFFPFKAKEQVFNLGGGFSGESLSKEFLIYNFGGDSLHLENISSEDKSLDFEFFPKRLAHNEFARMIIRLDGVTGDLGFTRRNVKMKDSQGKTVAVLPVQYTLEENTSYGHGRAEMALSKINHDFKVVKTGEVRRTAVTISNVGSENLEIKKLESNCDCLTYELDREIVRPGESVQLEVTFDATSRIGYERKTLAIFSNDAERSTRVLVFRAHVK